MRSRELRLRRGCLKIARQRRSGAIKPAIERLTALAFIVTGLSHLLAPRALARFFERVAAQGEAAGIWNGLLHLPLGLVIVAFHPVREGPGLAGLPRPGHERVGYCDSRVGRRRFRTRKGA